MGDLEIDLLVVEVNYLTDDIVRKLIINKLFDILHDLIDQPTLLAEAACLQACLHDAAALLVPSNLEGVVDHGLVDGFLVLVFG